MYTGLHEHTHHHKYHHLFILLLLLSPFLLPFSEPATTAQQQQQHRRRSRRRRGDNNDEEGMVYLPSSSLPSSYSPGFKALAISMMMLLMIGGCQAFRVAAALRQLTLRPVASPSCILSGIR